MNTKEEIKPDLKIFLDKQTEYWRDPPSQISDIYGIYLYDANLHVHCCSFTPSYESWFVAHYWVADDYDELTDREIYEADDYVLSVIVDQRIEYYNTNISEDSIADVNDEWVSSLFLNPDTDTIRNNMDEVLRHLMESYVHEELAYKILQK